MNQKPLTWATRSEIEAELIPFFGQVPGDLQGHVYVNSPCGTVNSQGFPIPKYLPDGSINPEWGDTLFNGDGLMFRFDLDVPGKIRFKTALLKTPDYWADEATRFGTEYHKKGVFFAGMGIARTSLYLGSRNQINTSVNLFQFPGDATTRVTANFDAGRPYEIDPVTMETITPIGANSEWIGEMPPFLDQPFPLVQATAHPAFDPRTGEFFTVNFTKSFSTLIFSKKFTPDLVEDEAFVTAEIEKLTEKLDKKSMKAGEFVGVVDRFVGYLKKKKSQGHQAEFDVDGDGDIDADDGYKDTTPADALGMEDEVKLLRWTGQGPLSRWNILDETTGQDLVIEQTMHQIALSKDYIVLVDTSLKFALDILESNSFPNHPWLNRLLRRLTARTIQPVTPLYIIKRSDLVEGRTNVTAKKVWIELETVHFSLDYDNPDQVITVHTSHNSALCAAEWVRPYDFLAVDPSKPVEENTVGIMTCGEMDIGRIGKFLIDGETGEIVDKSIIWKKGFEGPVPQKVGAHTWAVGLNTYRDNISAQKIPAKIPYIFWQFYGLDKRMLTQFIKELYQDYQNRIIPVKDLLSYTEHGIPFAICLQNTATMELQDAWVFRMNENLRSLQFVPKKRAAGETAPVPAELDGYILCTMINGSEDLRGDDYTREIWIFDAARLSSGPICKLSHPELSYAFTIHSAWSPEARPSPRTYNVPVRKDYEELFATFRNPEKRQEMEKFFEKNVFPHYTDQGA